MPGPLPAWSSSWPRLSGMTTSAARLASATGITVSPRFSGGEVIRSVDHGTYKTVIHRPVFDGLIGERRDGFIQIEWHPVTALPPSDRGGHRLYGRREGGFRLQARHHRRQRRAHAPEPLRHRPGNARQGQPGMGGAVPAPEDALTPTHSPLPSTGPWPQPRATSTFMPNTPLP